MTEKSDLTSEGREAMRLIRKVAKTDPLKALSVSAAILQTIVVGYSDKNKWEETLSALFEQMKASIRDFKRRNEAPSSSGTLSALSEEPLRCRVP